jgi:hypothetical protein
MNQPPVAKPGDEATFQISRCAVAQVGLTDPHNEISVMGIIPNAKDGARVFVGAGLRRKELAGIGNLAHQVAGALLNPAETVQMSAQLVFHARRAAVLRGQIIAPQDTPELRELIVFLVDSLPNEARMAIVEEAMAKINAELNAEPEALN